MSIETCHSSWKAGVSRVCITPGEPIRLAGYGGRTTPTGVVRQDIYARAIALEDETGTVSVILSTDLLGFSRTMADELTERVLSDFGVPAERLVLNSSHNHSGPVTGDLLHLYFDMGADEKAGVQRYTSWLMDRLVEAIGTSLQQRVPVELSFNQNFAGFGVNRRRTRGERHLPAPVDHDVPVLMARTADGGLKAVLFGYACHTTASCGEEIHGDYAGFAQCQLEELYPGTTALYLAGCGGDINPLPRYRPESPALYGNILATAVEDVIEGRNIGTAAIAVGGPLRTTFKEVDLPLEEPYTREELEARLPGAEGVQLRETKFALARYERGETPARSVPFPVQVWAFGQDLLWIWLSGEPVVDYALRFKAAYGWDNTWVSGYCNELVSYVPSARVRNEGGYEGTLGMLEYGLPGLYSPEVEEVITSAVEEMVGQLRDSEDSSPREVEAQSLVTVTS